MFATFDPVSRLFFKCLLGIVALLFIILVFVVCLAFYGDQLRRFITAIKSAPGSVARRIWNGMNESGRRLPSMYVFNPDHFAGERIAGGGLGSLPDGQIGFVPRHHRKGTRGLDRS
jgi:hypothetical protein